MNAHYKLPLVLSCLLIALTTTLWVQISHNITHTLPHTSGSLIWIGLTFFLVFILVYITIRFLPGSPIAQAITSSTEAIFKDKALQAKYQQLITEHINAVIIIYDVEFRPIYVSPSAQRITGYTLDEFHAGKFVASLHPDDAPQLQQVMTDLLSEPGKQAQIHFRSIHKDSSVQWIEGYAQSISDEKVDKVKYIVSINHNVTERKLYEDKLKETNKRFRLIADNASDVIALYTIQGEALYVSAANEIVLGYSEEEALTLDIDEYIHPDDRDLIANVRNELRHNPTTPFRFELRAVHKAGHTIWMESTVKTVLNPDTNEVEAIVAVSRDISERKKLESEIREQQDIFRIISENTSDIITLFNTENEVTYITPSVYDVLGYKQEEMHRIQLLELVHPDDYTDQSSEAYLQSMFSGEENTYRFRARHKNGHYIWFEGIVRDIFESDGKTPRMRISIAHDITDHIQAQRKLKREQLHLNLLAEQARDLFTTCDPDGMLTFVSPSIKHLLGFDAEELKETPFVDLLHKDDQQAWIDAYLENFNNPQDLLRFEHRISNHEGEYIWFETYTHSLMDEDNESIEALGTISRDITIQKQNETALQEQLEQRLLAIGEKSNRMRDIARQVKQVLESITPTGESLRVYAKRLAEDDQSHHLIELIKTADHLGDLITQLTNQHQ